MDLVDTIFKNINDIAENYLMSCFQILEKPLHNQ